MAVGAQCIPQPPSDNNSNNLQRHHEDGGTTQKLIENPCIVIANLLISLQGTISSDVLSKNYTNKSLHFFATDMANGSVMLSLKKTPSTILDTIILYLRHGIIFWKFIILIYIDKVITSCD